MKRNSNSFDAITFIPNPEPKKTVKQIVIKIERMKRMPNNLKEALEISKKNWDETIIAELENVLTDDKFIIVPSQISG